MKAVRAMSTACFMAVNYSLESFTIRLTASKGNFLMLLNVWNTAYGETWGSPLLVRYHTSANFTHLKNSSLFKTNTLHFRTNTATCFIY